MARHDWRTTMASGWALSVAQGLDGDAFELLRAGFETWRDEPGYAASLRRRFLEQLVGELIEDPVVSAEPRGLPAGAIADPAATQYAARCWAASELLELGVEPVMERMLYGVITRSVAAFVPARSAAWALDYAARHDLPPPWSAVDPDVGFGPFTRRSS